MPLSARRVARKAPERLVASTCSHSSSSSCIERPSARTPALFTSTSTGPKRCSSSAKSSLTASGSATSPRTDSAWPPAASISETTPAAPSSSVRKFTPTGQPSAASMRAIAAPIPREAPVTSALPSRAIADPPFHQRAAPGEAGAERAHQHTHARLEAAVGLGLRERDRDRRRGGVAVGGDAVDHPLERQAELLPDGGDDARVGLVIDEEVDVVGGEAGPLQHLKRDLGDAGHGLYDSLVALHLD